MVACVATILASCSTNAGAGAYAGASMGGMLGSAIGGITGGWRGSNIGTLVGAATGAALGAAAGAADDDDREARVAERRRARNAYERVESDRDQGYYVGTDRYSGVRERILRGERKSRRNRTTGSTNHSYQYAPAQTESASPSTSTSGQGFHFEKVQDPSGFKKEGGYDDKIDMD